MIGRGRMVYRVFLGMIILMLASKHSLGEAVAPVVVDVPLKKVFVPAGFDSNDRVQFAVGGELKNSCYKIASNSVTVHPETKTIVVKQQAYVYLGFCLMMIVPYSDVITLGIMEQPGDYQIIDGSSGQPMGRILINLARNVEQDEYLYAPVTDVSLATQSGDTPSENNPEKNKLVLRGTFTNSCMSIKEVKVSYNENSIVVQPLAHYAPQTENCKEEKRNFSQEVSLDSKLAGEYLVHVRSLNGAAINKVVEFGF